tara:strand:- start:1147 stop:1608 length:462 start_codon:yes stop_codon:yes gene_type:complete
MENIISKEELMAVPYKELLEKFTELNVKDAWKPGTKREKMVENAIDKIKVLRKLEKEGLTPEEMEEKAKSIIKAELLNKELKLEKDRASKLLAEDQSKLGVRKRLEKLNLDEPTIIKVIEGINRNLLNNIPGQRKILLIKLDILQEILAEKQK